MSQTPASKSQIRAASLCSVKIDYTDYTAAGAALEAAGINSAGLPAGHTWRSAAKLSDADLLSALRASSNVTGQGASALADRERAAAWNSLSRKERLSIELNAIRRPARDEAMQEDMDMLDAISRMR